jgi:hypothetical protein
LSNFIWEKLQSNRPVELDVFGLVDHAHATTTDLFENAVKPRILLISESGMAVWLAMGKTLVPLTQNRRLDRRDCWAVLSLAAFTKPW